MKQEIEHFINDKIETFRKDEQKIRHENNKNVTNQLFAIDNKVDDYKTDLALLKQGHSTMQKDLSDIKNDMKEGFSEIKQLFKGLDTKFATKAEHGENKLRIENVEKRADKYDKGIWWIVTLIIGAIVLAVLNLLKGV